MTSSLRASLLRCIARICVSLNRHVIFRHPAQSGHDRAIDLLRLLERAPFAVPCCKLARRLTLPNTPISVGGARLSQRLIAAAGLVKGDGFADEAEALAAVTTGRRNILPGWRALPALLGTVEFGSFTRHPRLGNDGIVVWRDVKTQSTQNRIGLRNPGARAGARFLGDRHQQLPREYGINIAVSPGVDDLDQQTCDVLESLSFFLDAGLSPNWFTLNLSCPNTEDDPSGRQLDTETRRLCGAFITCLRSRKLHTPLWVKVSPGLASEQYRALMRVFAEVGVNAVVATNTLARPSPSDAARQAGVGGGDLFPEALDAVQFLLAEKSRMNYAIDVIACGGIMDGASFRQYLDLGVKAGQYWSALVFRGPFAAAIIENELAQHEHEFETVRRESLA